MSTLVKALVGYFGTAALNITSEAMIELLEMSPRLKVMFMTKSYQRSVERLLLKMPVNDYRVIDIGPQLHKCVDQLCPLCVRRRVEVN